MLPIYPSPLHDDGYDVADYRTIHPDYGTLDDFRRLVAEAHRRGLRVVVELIPNHTSDQHAWFQASAIPRILSTPPTGIGTSGATPTTDTARRAHHLPATPKPSNWTFDPVRGQYFWHRFYHHQPDLNYDNPGRAAPRCWTWSRFWLDLGVDGFRVDAMPYLFEREGTNCENLPETHAFLRKLRAHIDAKFSDRMLLSEANQWPEDVRPYFGDGDEFHMNFHFPGDAAHLHGAGAGRAHAHRGNPGPHAAAPRTAAQWATFLRNHDELTLEMVTPEERDFMWQTYAPEPRMKINLGIRRRLAPLLENDRRPDRR